MTTIQPEQFADTLIKLIEAYAVSMRLTLQGDTLAAAQECAEDLKRTSPRSRAKGRHYANGWTVEERFYGDRTSYVVRNKPKPGLTHLLEKGHGGPNPAPAYPHIEPAYDRARARLIGKLK